TFPGVEQILPLVANATSFADYLSDWEIVLQEPDQITTNTAKFESLLRNEYDAAAENGRAVYPPEKVTTPGTEVLEFLGRARISFSEVHIGSPSSAASRQLLPASGEKGTGDAHGVSPSPRLSGEKGTGDAHRESPSPRVSGERVAEGRVRGPDEIRLNAPSTDRYTNRLPEFTGDVARSSRRQIFFAATKGGREKVQRLLKEVGVTGIDMV